ncbi:MAG: hypothetical protein ACK5X3_07005, partial [Pseudomonadota bacterium]|jgi:hypothetical protein
MTYKQHDVMKTLYQIAERFDLPTGWDSMAAIAREIRLSHRILDRNAINRCNGIERWDSKAQMRLASWTDEDEAKADKSDAKAEARVRAAIFALFAGKDHLVSVSFQGDPRGALIVLEALGYNGYSERIAGW